MKRFILLLLLLLAVFLFALENRLSNGLPPEFFNSFIYAVLLLATLFLAELLTLVHLPKALNIFFILVSALFSGFFISVRVLRGVSGEAGIGVAIVAPILILATALAALIIVALGQLALKNERRLTFFLWFAAVIIIILLSAMVGLFAYCGSRGCSATSAPLARKALVAHEPQLCARGYDIRQDPVLQIARLGFPLLFPNRYNENPSRIGDLNCYYTYALTTLDINACGLTKGLMESCVEEIIKQKQPSQICEVEDQPRLRSLCYFTLARQTHNNIYCEYLPSIYKGSYTKDICLNVLRDEECQRSQNYSQCQKEYFESRLGIIGSVVSVQGQLGIGEMRKLLLYEDVQSPSSRDFYYRECKGNAPSCRELKRSDIVLLADKNNNFLNSSLDNKYVKITGRLSEGRWPSNILSSVSRDIVPVVEISTLELLH